jgi:hypothetical protein
VKLPEDTVGEEDSINFGENLILTFDLDANFIQQFLLGQQEAGINLRNNFLLVLLYQYLKNSNRCKKHTLVLQVILSHSPKIIQQKDDFLDFE